MGRGMKEARRKVSPTVHLFITLGDVVFVGGNVLKGRLETGHQINADLVSRCCVGVLCACLLLPSLPSLQGCVVHGSLQQLLVALPVLLHSGQGTLVVNLHTTHTSTKKHTLHRANANTSMLGEDEET